MKSRRICTYALTAGLALALGAANAWAEDDWECVDDTSDDDTSGDYEWGDDCGDTYDGPGSAYDGNRRRKRRNARRQDNDDRPPPVSDDDSHVTYFDNPSDSTRADDLAGHTDDDTYIAGGHGIPGEMEEVDTDYFVDQVADRIEDGEYCNVSLHVCHAGESTEENDSVGQTLFDELYDRLGEDTPTVYAPNGAHGSFEDAYGNPNILVVDEYLTPLAPADSYTAYDQEHPDGRPATPEEILEMYGDGAHFQPEPRGGYGSPPPNDGQSESDSDAPETGDMSFYEPDPDDDLYLGYDFDALCAMDSAFCV